VGPTFSGIANHFGMLSLTHTTRIFLCPQPTDMRLGHEGLRNRVGNQFHQNPLSGHLFVFFNKSRNRCKILFYDSGGLCLFCKRLELGTFSIPNLKQIGERIEIDRVEFILFLDGVISHGMKRNKRYSPSENTRNILKARSPARHTEDHRGGSPHAHSARAWSVTLARVSGAR